MTDKKNNRGRLFRNKNRTNERQPTHKGDATINGADYWVSAWTMESAKDGERFFSMTFEDKETAKTYTKTVPQGQNPNGIELDDDAPF